VHRSESNTLVSCLDCGAELRPGPDRGYTFGADGVLCFDCALRRGGRYDELRERWSEDPRIDDLGPEFD